MNILYLMLFIILVIIGTISLHFGIMYYLKVSRTLQQSAEYILDEVFAELDQAPFDECTQEVFNRMTTHHIHDMVEDYGHDEEELARITWEMMRPRLADSKYNDRLSVMV